MRRIVFFISVIITMSWLGACNKDAVTPIVYKDTVVNNNKIPPYKGVTLIQEQTYINRLYIDLIGRIPVLQEMYAGVKLLNANPFSDSVRQIIIKGLINTPDYYKRFFQVASARMLNATDSAAIADQILLFNSQVDIYVKQGDAFTANAIKIEVQKMVDLQHAYADYEKSAIDISGFMARMLNNYFYDQVNMGTFNFLKAAFEDLLHRSPTLSEQTAATNMVNGTAAFLFLQDGTNKGDFIKIMTSTRDFYEGQVVETFTRYLVRAPDSAELGAYTTMVMPTRDLKPMLFKILASKEYAGF